MEYADDGDLFQKIMEYKKKKVYMDEKKVWRYSIQAGKFLIVDVEWNKGTARFEGDAQRYEER